LPLATLRLRSTHVVGWARARNAQGAIAMAYPLPVATARSYWLDLFSGQSWAEFIAAGASTSGFREGRRKTVARIRPGDYLIPYLVGVSRFVGVLEVISELYEDHTPIWKDAVFPERVKVKPLVTLKAETAVPVHDLLDRFTWWPKLRSPQGWTGYFRSSPWRMDPADGEMLVEAIRDAEAHPAAADEIPAAAKETRAHTEIQWLLLKLGNDMGLDVWVARNDRGRQYGGKRFADLPKMVTELPLKSSSRAA
jgi:predicted RNA-binding protein